MGKLAEAYVDIVANTKNLDTNLARAKAGISSFVSFAGSALARVGAVAGVGSVGALGAGMAVAAKKAADLGESVSKVGFIFDKSAKLILDNSDALAKNFGAIKQQTLDAAAAFGLMGQAAGMSKQKSAELGAEFVKLGLDAASFFNVTNEEAFTVLRSGLAGETEPLRRFGVLLSEAALQSEAVALGITKVKRELTDVEKVQARTSLIRKGLAPAAGDLERTAGSTANQLKKLQGDWENAVVKFGQDLQGAMVEGLKLAREFGEVIRNALGGEDTSKALGETIQAGITNLRISTGQTKADAGKVRTLSAISDTLGMIGGIPGVDKLKRMVDRELDKEVDKAGPDFSKPVTKAEIDARAKSAEKSKKFSDENVHIDKDARQFVAKWLAKQSEPSRNFFEGLKQVLTPADLFKKLAPGVKGKMNVLEGAFKGGGIQATSGILGPLLGMMGGGGKLARDMLAATTVRPNPHQKQPTEGGQTFAPEDYARHGIEQALNQDPVPKEQLAVAKDILGVLMETKEVFRQGMMREPGQDRAVVPRVAGGAK